MGGAVIQLPNAVPPGWEVTIDGTGFGQQQSPKGDRWSLVSVHVSDIATAQYPVVVVWARPPTHQSLGPSDTAEPPAREREPELLPCPFCGWTSAGIDADMADSGVHQVVCDRCAACGPIVKMDHDVEEGREEEQAFALWNMRAP